MREREAAEPAAAVGHRTRVVPARILVAARDQDTTDRRLRAFDRFLANTGDLGAQIVLRPSETRAQQQAEHLSYAVHARQSLGQRRKSGVSREPPTLLVVPHVRGEFQ